MILDCGLIDAGFEDDYFTWYRDNLWQRLDRVLYSSSWPNLFNSTRTKHLPRTCSDHSPLLISVSHSIPKSTPSFRFMKMLSSHHLFRETIENSWTPPLGSYGLLNLQQNLLHLKQHLKGWNKTVFGNIFDAIAQVEAVVKIKEQIFDSCPFEVGQDERSRRTGAVARRGAGVGIVSVGGFREE
ncbi:hypothetical protein BUALT_Bualt03G0202100 [Buddleja alternifolia]|uniref:Endonuclease/exonuclease/phosphatase n=1 Tax=Buddleja alternifolia TaxID=168488 RepID=A0AAV6XVB2_9LAMI|nr:hypothetical protein BUALT_Bualt03G0202100 [Buddleja alternifolia]